MSADRDRLSIAERAAGWLVRLDTATPEERAEFVEWLRQSPLHVAEFLAAKATQVQLAQLFQNGRLDADAFVPPADNSR